MPIDDGKVDAWELNGWYVVVIQGNTLDFCSKDCLTNYVTYDIFLNRHRS